LSKPANLLLKIAFSRFCHSEFVYDTDGVCFTYNLCSYTLYNQAVQLILSEGAPLFILPS